MECGRGLPQKITKSPKQRAVGCFSSGKTPRRGVGGGGQDDMMDMMRRRGSIVWAHPGAAGG